MTYQGDSQRQLPQCRGDGLMQACDWNGGWRTASGGGKTLGNVLSPCKTSPGSDFSGFYLDQNTTDFNQHRTDCKIVHFIENRFQPVMTLHRQGDNSTGSSWGNKSGQSRVRSSRSQEKCAGSCSLLAAPEAPKVTWMFLAGIRRW